MGSTFGLRNGFPVLNSGRLGYRNSPMSLLWGVPTGTVADPQYLEEGYDELPDDVSDARLGRARERARATQHVVDDAQMRRIEMEPDVDDYRARKAALREVKLFASRLGRAARAGRMLGIFDAVGTAQRVAATLEAIFGPAGGGNEVAAVRPQEFWPGKNMWTLNLDCASQFTIVDPSPFHYPSLMGSSCTTLWSHLIDQRNLYAFQTIAGVQYRTMRLMRDAELNIDLSANPGFQAGDRGRTWQQWSMPESAFQAAGGPRRRGAAEVTTSLNSNADQAPASGYAAQVHPSARPVLGTHLTPRPLPRAVDGVRPVNQWPEGPQAGNYPPARPGQAEPGVGEPGPGEPGVGPGEPGTSGPTGPSVPAVVAGGGLTAFEPPRAGRHHRRPPGRNEREAKFRGVAERVLAWIVNVGTEVMDVVEAARSVLPPRVQLEVGYDPVAIGEWLWDNWSTEVAFKLLGAVALNLVEDEVAGRVIGKSQAYGWTHYNPLTGHRRVSSNFGVGLGDLGRWF